MTKNVYLGDGSKAELVGELEGKYLVRQILIGNEDYDEYEYSSDVIMEVGRIYDEVPKIAYDERLVEVKKQIDEEKSKLKKIKEEVSKYTDDQKEIVSKLEINDAVKYVFDYIEGKITHFVIGQYSGYKIETFNEAVKERDTWRNTRRLITLSADESAKPSWRINAYRDGSGSDNTVYPCKSYEEAQSKLQSLMADDIKKLKSEIDSGKGNLYAVNSLLKASVEYEIEIPEWLKVYKADRDKKQLEGEIENTKKVLEEKKKALKELS
jgi:hypothetical protein